MAPTQASPGTVKLDYTVSEPSAVHVETCQLLSVQVEAERRSKCCGSVRSFREGLHPLDRHPALPAVSRRLLPALSHYPRALALDSSLLHSAEGSLSTAKF